MVHLLHDVLKPASDSPTLDHFHRNQWTNSPEYAPNPCNERDALRKAVVDAVDAVYRARTAFEIARTKKASDVDALSVRLQKARDAERMAEKRPSESYGRTQMLIHF